MRTRAVTMLSGLLDPCMKLLACRLYQALSRSVHNMQNMEHLDGVTATHLARVTTVHVVFNDLAGYLGVFYTYRRGQYLSPKRTPVGDLYDTNSAVPFNQVRPKRAKHDSFSACALSSFTSQIYPSGEHSDDRRYAIAFSGSNYETSIMDFSCIIS